jgi:hypothetical protein
MRRAVYIVLSALLVLAQPPLTVDAQNGDELLTLEHYLQWEEVQSPQASPDGEQIVYTRRFMDGVNDEWRSELWIMRSDGTRNRFLVEGSSPRWSPDGTRIAYLASGEPRGTQVFVRWMDDEGATSQVTRVEHSPSNIEWSPDGRSISFQALVADRPDPAWEIDLPRRPEGADWADDAHIEERLHFRRDRMGFLPRGHQHVFVVSADGGTPRQLTRGDWDHTSPRWTADGPDPGRVDRGGAPTRAPEPGSCSSAGEVVAQERKNGIGDRLQLTREIVIVIDGRAAGFERLRAGHRRRQHVDRPPRLDVDQHGGVPVASAHGEVVDLPG